MGNEVAVETLLACLRSFMLSEEHPVFLLRASAIAKVIAHA
jgi:hypothetical protein